MTHADPFAIPMRGTVLVEASAGTGKTHRITTLFVRLVLERSLDVAQILVVTFTNAATAELRARVRRRLHEALTAFDLGGAASDPELVELVRRSRHPDADRAKIARALEDVDRASVFTIHAFCQRVLEEHAFEGGVRFDVELSPNIEPLVVEIVQDFCTQRLGSAPKNAVEYLRANQLGLAALVRTGMYAARMPDAPLIADGTGTDLERAVDEYRAARRHYAEAWSTGKSEVRTLLLSTQALNGNSYSPAIRERALAEAEAAHATAEDSLIGISDDFRRLTTASIRKAVKRNCIEPKHAAFDACQELITAAESLNAAFEDWALALQRDLVDRVRSELPARSAEISVMSFDDLIHGVFAALNGPRGRALAATLRRRFPAALIDEFQDTDPVQYDIFRKVYATTRGASLFLIGDPKQAIYGFRGADIFAYLEASHQAGEPFTLDTNFRSDPTLVRAVNAVFSRSPEPFLLKGIDFSQVRSPPERADALSLGGAPVSGLDVLFVGKMPAENGRGRTSPKPEMVPELVARDIAQTLASKTTLRHKTSTGKITEEELHPGHFAVLTRSNKEAREVQIALTALGIPNVLHGDQSVLDTDEADDMARVLDALADPRSADAVRAALSTNLLGLDATALFDLGEDEARWERWTTDFSRWSDLWERSGFLTAMRRLFTDLRVSERLLESRGGERRLTNFMHLAELLHREASERRLGVSGLLAWFDLVRLEKSARLDVAPEAQQVRLESDEFRVQLTTVHRSKGLEYPIVYLPFLFGKMGLLQKEEHNLRYHDPAHENRMVLDIRPKDRKGEARQQAESEACAEGLRLAYVALTRAKHRTVVVWGPFKDASKSALAHLFDAKHPLRATSGADSVEEETMLEDVRSLAHESDGAIRIRTPDAGSAPPWRGDGTTSAALVARALKRRLGPGFRTSSFTSLTAGAEVHAPIDEGRDLDPEAPLDAGPVEPVVVGPKVPLHDFPRGPRAGNALHLALEEADFERKDPDELARAVQSSLARHGFSAPDLAPQVTDALASALRTPLLAENPALCLERIARDKRVSEMEFTFPLGDDRRSRAGSLVTANALAKVLRERKSAPYPRDYPNRVQALGFQPLAGFLRGFIDLVFEHENRFYVVDYKSNYLGDAPSHYRQPSLVDSMARHHYFLQYHLYCVALHRTLELRLRDYAPAEHLGGVFYLFLRGMAEERGPSTGVFFDRPEPAAIEGLSRTLGTIREARA